MGQIEIRHGGIVAVRAWPHNLNKSHPRNPQFIASCAIAYRTSRNRKHGHSRLGYLSPMHHPQSENLPPVQEKCRQCAPGLKNFSATKTRSGRRSFQLQNFRVAALVL
jgi:hypothetical protein